jgi:hypothetical protein
LRTGDAARFFAGWFAVLSISLALTVRRYLERDGPAADYIEIRGSLGITVPAERN